MRKRSVHTIPSGGCRYRSSEFVGSNLQNIPVKKFGGPEDKAGFVPDPGFKMVAADYSQIELRNGPVQVMRGCCGHLLPVRMCIAQLRPRCSGGFTGTGQRGTAAFSQKRSTSGLIYGMSAFGLARQLGIERGAARLMWISTSREISRCAEFMGVSDQGA